MKKIYKITCQDFDDVLESGYGCSIAAAIAAAEAEWGEGYYEIDDNGDMTWYLTE